MAKKKKTKWNKTRRKAWLSFLLFGVYLALVAVIAFKIYDISEKKKAEEERLASLVISEEEIVIREEETSTEVFVEPEPEWECYLSQDCLDKDSDWNLINTVETSDGVTDYIPINPIYYYVAYCPGEMTVTAYDENEKEITTLTKDVSSGLYFHFTGDARYVKLCLSGDNNYFVSSGIREDAEAEAESESAFYVISPNAPVEMSISQAVANLKHCGTVLILPGTYEDNICNYNKVINLYGVDRDKCQIVSYDGDYDNPPLEIAAGYVRNLSFMALGRDNNHSKKAYAVHADYDYQNTKSLTFYNCYMYSDYNSGLGMGTRTGTVTINSCTIVGHNDENGDFFLHDTVDPNFTGECNITIKNSTFGKLVLNAMEIDGNDVTLTIKNNFVNSIEGYNMGEGGYYDGFFRGLKNFALSSDSDVQ